MVFADQLKRDGYIIIRDIFSRNEIENLRATIQEIFARTGIYKYGGKHKLHVMHASSKVAQLLFNAAFINMIKECTHPHPCLLTGECDIQVNILSKWHKDIKEAWAERASVHSDPEWSVYKAAIYLQDQDDVGAGALRVRPGSHLLRLGVSTEERIIPVRAGDVVIFDVRIDHVGRTASLGNKVLQRSLALVAPWLRMDHEISFAVVRAKLSRLAGAGSHRMGAFLTFGPNLPCTYGYEEMGRADHGQVSSALDPAILAKLMNAQIDMIHPQVMSS